MKETANSPEERAKLTLQQKFVKLREAIPALAQKAYSDGVKYNFLKVSDIYEHLTPAMNEWGVNFDIIGEKATRHAANGDELYYHNYVQHTRNGDRIIWVYEADLAIRWTNADNPADVLDVTLHAIGCNDSSPDKAKGSALTYAVKYMLFNKFSVDQGADDPDMNDLSGSTQPAGQNGSTEPRNGSGGRNTRQQQGKAGGKGTEVQKGLSDAQLSRMYRKGEAAGMTKEKIDSRIAEKYKIDDPRNLTRDQYDEICKSLDGAAKKEEHTNA